MSEFLKVSGCGVAINVETKMSTNGNKSVNFLLAVHKYKKRKNSDEYDQKTVWRKCKVWGMLAERFAQNVKHGDTIALDGEEDSFTFKGDDGKDVTMDFINVNTFHVVRPRKEDGGSSKASKYNKNTNNEMSYGEEAPF